MRDGKKQERHQAITEAAYALLAEKGYSGTSMLNVAKAAKASNETLYRWYGDKDGLFLTMVQDNAEATKKRLTAALAAAQDPMRALTQIAPLFLEMLLGQRAVLLNRAAAADPSGKLGAAISTGGREVIQPLFRQLIQATGRVSEDRLDALTKTFVSLLIGDAQIKCVIGVMDTPTEKEIAAHCAAVFQDFEAVLNSGL